MAENNLEETNEEFYGDKVVEISIDGSKIGWHPMLDTLGPDYNDQDAVDFARSIEDYIRASDYNGYIMATPEGPSFEASVRDIGAVIWATYSLYGDLPIRVKGDAPTLEDLGLDEASNYDEDGTQITR